MSNPQVYYLGPWISYCIILYPRGRSKRFITTYVHIFHSFFSSCGRSFLSSVFAHSSSISFPPWFIFDTHLYFFPSSRHLIPFSNGVGYFGRPWSSFEFFFRLFQIYLYLVRAMSSARVYLLFSCYVSATRLSCHPIPPFSYVSLCFIFYSNPPSTRR